MSAIFEKTLENKLEFLIHEVPISETLSSVCAKLGYSDNGRYTKALSLFLKKHSIDFSHFRTSRSWPKNMQEAKCPVCGTSFLKNMNNIRDSKKVTCSHKCGNNYFAWKQGSKNYKDGVKSYSDKLSRYLESHGVQKSCIVCGNTEILDCHHVDEDRSNSEINNLVFLCPNHHLALHRFNSEEVFLKIIEHLDYRDTL